MFEEITCTEGRRSRILYEFESHNGMTKSRISLVENFEKIKVLAVELSVDSLGSSDGRNSLPVPQRKKNQSFVESMTSTPRRTRVFFMLGAAALILLIVGGIVAYKFFDQDSDVVDEDMTSDTIVRTTLDTSGNQTICAPFDLNYSNS